MNFQVLMEIINTVHGLYTSNIFFYQEIDQYIYLLFHMALKFFCHSKGGYTLVTLPCTVTSYRDSVDGTHDHVTYQKLVMQ
jgi:hypothetical protein